MVKKLYNVIPNPQGGWDVLQEEPTVSLFHFEDKESAVEKACEICKETGTDLFIHSANGRYRVQETFSKE